MKCGQGKPFTMTSSNAKISERSPIKSYKDGGLVTSVQDISDRDVKEASPDASRIGGSMRGVSGRAGYKYDMGEDSGVTAGVTGASTRVKPEGMGSMSKNRVTGADISYRKGDTSVGVEVSRNSPTDKRVMLRFKKEF